MFEKHTIRKCFLKFPWQFFIVLWQDVTVFRRKRHIARAHSTLKHNSVMCKQSASHYNNINRRNYVEIEKPRLFLKIKHIWVFLAQKGFLLNNFYFFNSQICVFNLCTFLCWLWHINVVIINLFQNMFFILTLIVCKFHSSYTPINFRF